MPFNNMHQNLIQVQDLIKKIDGNGWWYKGWLHKTIKKKIIINAHVSFYTGQLNAHVVPPQRDVTLHIGQNVYK